jgi:hypothetical protein
MLASIIDLISSAGNSRTSVYNFPFFNAFPFDFYMGANQMLIMGGFQSTARIWEYKKAINLLRTPIAGSTAHAMFGDRGKCLMLIWITTFPILLIRTD